MADLFDLLQSQMGENVIGALAGQLGNAEPKKTSTAASGAASILMNALARNARDPKSASALGSALDRDHDGSILDDVVGFINGTSSHNNTRAGNGAGILGHILGGQQGSAIESLMKTSGLSKDQSSSLLMKMAPIVLGMLGKQKKTQGLDMSGLGSVLTNAASTAKKRSPGGDLLTSFLDQDGDGSIKDDAARIGFSLLKNLFRGKR